MSALGCQWAAWPQHPKAPRLAVLWSKSMQPRERRHHLRIATIFACLDERFRPTERFSHGLSGIFHLRKCDFEILFPLFKALFFRTYTSVFEKVNKTSLMFTPTASKIKHVKTNERRGCSNQPPFYLRRTTCPLFLSPLPR